MHVQPLVEIDPFDLPDWLGTAQVVWHADGGLRGGPLVAGRLTSDGEPDLVCDLLGVDEAYPAPVTDDDSRLRVHQAWRHGQVVVGRYDGRLTLAAPGSAWTPELVLDALGRLARSVGAQSGRYAALLRLSG